MREAVEAEYAEKLGEAHEAHEPVEPDPLASVLLVRIGRMGGWVVLSAIWMGWLVWAYDALCMFSYLPGAVC